MRQFEIARMRGCEGASELDDRVSQLLYHTVIESESVAAIGVVASLVTNASYRIWYGFPGDYTAAQIVISFMSYVLAGLAMGAWLRPAKPAT